MKFNGITTGGGGSAATELTDWATRLDRKEPVIRK